jgi:hypothetical protein
MEEHLSPGRMITKDKKQKQKRCFEIFSRTNRPISIKLGTHHPWVRELKFVQRKGQVFSRGEIITKMQKKGVALLKYSRKPLGQKSSDLQ